MMQIGRAGNPYGGFSRLELVAAVMVISILAAVLLERLFYYQEVAEKARMEYTISRIKSGLRLRMAGLLVAGRAQEYALLANDNPMDWLEDKPDNYGGELASTGSEELGTGNWYFDHSSRTLFYLVRRGQHFQSGAEPKKVRLKVVSVRNHAVIADGSNADGPVDSVAIEIVEPYRWF